MQPKEKLKNIILFWILLTLLIFVVTFFILASSNLLIKEIILVIYFILPPLYTRNFYQDQKLDLESYINKKPQNISEEKIENLKETLQYTYVYFGFQLLFSFVLLVLAFSGIQIF